jgi:ribonucleoside-diphosphate reductase alpha chain
MNIINEIGRRVMQGGSRRSAIWAGLHWNHPTSTSSSSLKDWSDDIKRLKEKDYNFPAPLDMTNISVILDDAFFAAYYDSKHKQHSLANSVYWATVRHMLETAEPGFSIDVRRQRGRAPAQRLHRDHEPRRLRHLQPGLDQHGPDHLAGGDARGRRGRHAFLLAGTVYSEVPYEKVAQIRRRTAASAWA